MSIWLDHISTAFERLRQPNADPAQYLLRHGTMRAGLYAPSQDDQQPHAQDEFYFIYSGTAVLERGEERSPIEEGHLIFVPAGMPHRFHDSSEDFVTLVVFWGPQSGEPE